MRAREGGSGTMRERKVPRLESPTAALVRVAAAVATGKVPELDARLAAAREARVPGLWIEELLLQSMLVVGYPLALVAFAAWRGVGGPAPIEGDGAEDLAHADWESWARRGGVPRGVRARLSQVAREPARAAPGARGPRPGGRLRQGHRAARPRSQAARALHGGDDRGARHRRAAAFAFARSAEHGGVGGRDRGRSWGNRWRSRCRAARDGAEAVGGRQEEETLECGIRNAECGIERQGRATGRSKGPN